MRKLTESEAMEDDEMRPNGFFNTKPTRGKDGGGDQIMPGSPLHAAVVQISEFIDRPGVESEVRKTLLEQDVPKESIGWAISLARKIKAETSLDG